MSSQYSQHHYHHKENLMKMLQSENKAVCFRLPIDNIQALDKVAAYCGLSRANLMRDMVSQYLDYADQYILIKDFPQS